MQSDWDFYFCELDDCPASILVDLAYGDAGPVADLPYRLQLRITLQNPRPDGFPTRHESEKLAQLEDVLEAVCEEVGDGIRHVGRVTTNGVREYYFYCQTVDTSQATLAAALKDFSEYTPRFSAASDPQWEMYYQVLYPSDREMQMILNERVLRRLEASGDMPDVEREVVHWMSFASQEDRQEFIDEVQRLGFQAKAETDASTMELPFGVIVKKRQPTDRITVHQTVLALYDLTDQLGGVYDGWETSVVTAEDAR